MARKPGEMPGQSLPAWGCRQGLQCACREARSSPRRQPGQQDGMSLRAQVQHLARTAMPGYARITFAIARETAKMALAPSLALLSVPSSSFILSSTSFCCVGSMPWPAISQDCEQRYTNRRHTRCAGKVGLTTSAGAMMSLILLTALETPLPVHLSSRRAHISCFSLGQSFFHVQGNSIQTDGACRPHLLPPSLSSTAS